MLSLNRRSLLKFGLVFVVAVIAMELFGRLIEAQDTVLPSAERVMRAAPQVLSAVGEIKCATLEKSLYYDDIPEREVPYREYSFGVTGNKSQAFVVIRAERQNEKYSYRVARLEQ